MLHIVDINNFYHLLFMTKHFELMKCSKRKRNIKENTMHQICHLQYVKTFERDRMTIIRMKMFNN